MRSPDATRDTRGEFPPAAAAAVRLLVGWARAAYAEDLVSVVVHGSLADLAAHLLVARTAGVVVHGEPIKNVLRRVREEEFLDSIRADVLESCKSLLEPAPPQIPVPVYEVLNLARTQAWLREGLVLSKRDGGRWLRAADPVHSAVLTSALDEYAEPCGRLAGSDGVRKLALAVLEGLL